MWRGLKRHHGFDGDASPVERANLLGVVGEQTGASNPGGPEDLHGFLVVAAVDRQSQPAVGLDRVMALVLQHVRLELGDQPNPAALVAGGV